MDILLQLTPQSLLSLVLAVLLFGTFITTTFVAFVLWCQGK